MSQVSTVVMRLVAEAYIVGCLLRHTVRDWLRGAPRRARRLSSGGD